MFPAEMTVGSLIVTTQRHLTLTRVPPPPPPGPVLSASHQRQSREPVIGGISVLQLARGDWLDVSEEATAHFLPSSPVRSGSFTTNGGPGVGPG